MIYNGTIKERWAKAIMGENLPGPRGTRYDMSQIDQGTMCRAQSGVPGPAGKTSAAAVESRGNHDEPMSGGILFAVGQASVIRIPIPGTNGLAIELSPKGFIPRGGSTSTLFFQDSAGRRLLRLDYGFNRTTNTIDYHWNQRGTFADFNIADHSAAGRSGLAAYHIVKYFRYAGRVVIVAGMVIDIVSIAQASKPLKRASEVAAGWAGAWVGCKVIGAGGAAIGTLASPLGTAVGGIGGCIIGGIGGYRGGSILASEVYDWAEGTFFKPLPEAAGP
ncbi:MAG: hypothetical protein J0I60_09530 [Nitrosospira sp.]|nr:hypothetical protein [Nitrosospira sp.]